MTGLRLATTGVASSITPRVTHLGIEASRMLREKRGIGRYVRTLLVRLPEMRPGLRYTFFVRRARDVDALAKQLGELSPRVAESSRVVRWGALRRTDAEVVWYPWNYLNPPAGRSAMVTTVHDVAPMLQLDGRWWKWWKRYKQRSRYTRTVTLSDLVLTVSQFTADETRRTLPIDPSKLRVTQLGADPPPAGEAAADAAADALLARLGVSSPFFLAVGALDPRKNLEALHRAMARLWAQGERAPLVQCGPSYSLDGDRAADAQVRNAGFVSDAELTGLYRRATALVFPSRYEGFGLPVLEAMAAGGAVICADAASLPEVAGDAALLFPWHDVDALVERMTRLLRDPALGETLKARGRARAAMFSWDRCASGTLTAFDEALTRRLRRG